MSSESEPKQLWPTLMNSCGAGVAPMDKGRLARVKIAYTTRRSDLYLKLKTLEICRLIDHGCKSV